MINDIQDILWKIKLFLGASVDHGNNSKIIGRKLRIKSRGRNTCRKGRTKIFYIEFSNDLCLMSEFFSSNKKGLEVFAIIKYIFFHEKFL